MSEIRPAALRQSWPDPTPEMLEDPLFNAVWDVIKSWDIGVPNVYAGYCGATGNHARAIYDAVSRASEFAMNRTAGKGGAEMTPQQETNYRHIYGKLMETGDALRKLVIQHKSAALPSLTVPADVADKIIEAQQAVYEAQRRLEATLWNKKEHAA